MVEVNQELDNISSTWTGTSDMHVMSRVKHVHCKSLDKDVLRLIEESNARKMKDSKFWFLQFKMVASNLNENGLEYIINVGNP